MLELIVFPAYYLDYIEVLELANRRLVYSYTIKF